MKRKEDSWASLVPPDLMGAGAGPTGATAYDQTAQEDPGATGVTPAPDAAGDVQAPVPDAPTGLLAGATDPGAAGGGTTDDMTGAQLGQLTGGGASPDDAAFQQLQAALQDPNTSPEDRAAIEQQIALAARRQMLGGA